ERAKRLVVAAELDQCVTDDAVVARRVRGEPHRLAAEAECLPEAVSSEGERSERARRRRVPWVGAGGAVERLLGLRVVRGVARLPCALLVCEPEQRVAPRVARVRPQLLDELLYDRRRVPCGEARSEALACGRALHRNRARIPARVSERPADEGD